MSGARGITSAWRIPPTTARNTSAIKYTERLAEAAYYAALTPSAMAA